MHALQMLTKYSLQTRLDKLTLAVGEASVSRHNGGPMKGPPQYDNAVMHEGFGGALNWSSMIPRDASLSDSYKPARSSFSRLDFKRIFYCI